MDRIIRLIREAHRRSLWQVLAIYLGGSWVVAQVVSLVATHLALPHWVTPVAILLLMIGLPIVVATAFVQDRAPSAAGPAPEAPPGPAGPGAGTSAAPAADGVRGPGDGGEAPAGAPVHLRLLTWRNAIAGGVLAFALLGVVAAGYVGVRALGGNGDGAIDADAIAVLPFRVVADSSLAWLREGAVDLVGTKLTGQGGSRPVDARATLVQWRRVAGDGDVTEAEAMQIARRLGAGRVVLGDVVAGGGRLTLNARLVATVGGRSLAHASREGSADSVMALIDRVVAELLVRDAGEEPRRLETLTSTSLVAVRAYLAGQASYRRAQFGDAARHFATAVAEDSTFALAALYLSLAKGWDGYGPDYELGRRLAWEQRDRLGERDRKLLLAHAHPTYPDPAPPRLQIRAYEELLTVASDNAEAWYGYGDILFHQGLHAGVPDAWQRARTAFERAVAIDSSFGPALHHLIELVAHARDTALLAVLTKRLDGRTYEGGWLPWVVAEASGDSAALRALLQAADTIPATRLVMIMGYAMLHGIGLGTVPAIRAKAERRAVTEAERAAVGNVGFLHDANLGRPLAGLARIGPGGPMFGAVDFWRLVLATVGELEAQEGARAATALARRLPDLPADEADAGRCMLATWHATTGEPAQARAHLRQLRDAAAPELSFQERNVNQYCRAWIGAALAVAEATPDRAQRLAQMEKLLMEGWLPPGLREASTIWLAGVWEMDGDLARALAVTRRIGHNPFLLAAKLAQEGRLAERTGDRAGAEQAYRHFLLLRTDPEPGRQAESVEEARRALVRLGALG
jgi:TolB-like protein